jgi:primase-polymerase (primpol)-like protein
MRKFSAGKQLRRNQWSSGEQSYRDKENRRASHVCELSLRRETEASGGNVERVKANLITDQSNAL